MVKNNKFFVGTVKQKKLSNGGSTMRLTITGTSRSGKSTALHRLIAIAQQGTWAHILLADGKNVELHRYATPSLPVYGDHDPAAFAAALTATADRLTARYQQLSAQGLTAALPTDPRELIVIDEVQEFTRHPKYGKHVRAALIRIFEKSGALGDLVILTTQRAANAIPPSARTNANVELRMLGAGFYQLIAQGHPPRQGRVDPDAPLAAITTLTPRDLPLALSTPPRPRPPTPIVRYEGKPGSGRTYALQHHPNGTTSRHIYLDLQQHTHKSLLLACLQSCGASPPAGAPISELVEAAALALQTEPTLLLLDNVDAASTRARKSLQRLLDAAAAGAIALPPPAVADPEHDPLAELRQRAARVELQPLAPSQAAALIHQVAPAIDAASAAAIMARAAGNPKAITAYAERIAAHGDEERHALEAVQLPACWLLLFVLLAAFVGIVYVQRHLVDNEIVSAIVTGIIAMTLWLLRPRFMRLTRPK
jgi:hypothetical protein